jgi:predicted ATPase/DNA-binding SARP family transcriptional activator
VTANLRLSLLGPARITPAEKPAASQLAGKSLALLAYLVVHGRPFARGQPLSREHLADLFWQDLPAQRGRANLSWTLHKLSPSVPGCLQADRRTVAFCRADGCWIDLDAFEALEAAGDAGSLAEAAALYRGEFLQGLALDGCADFELWLVGERERWRQRAERALHGLIAHHAALARGGQGACAEALRYARRLLALAPWREGTHRAVMRLLAESGQRGAALAQYEACRRALETELGVEPSEETTGLYEQIVAGQVVIRRERRTTSLSPLSISPPAKDLPPHNLPAPLTPFVGREALLVEMADCLSNPACRLLTLVGPGGSGKTRLALEAAAQVHVDADGARRYADGVYWVSLAPLRSAEALAPAIAQAIGFSFYAAASGTPDPRMQLLNYLRNKRMLLILDNAEHLIDAPSGADRGVEGAVVDVLNAAPRVKFLVTSRARLNVPGEHLLSIGGMNLPPPLVRPQPLDGCREAHPLLAEPEAYSAVALFLQSARRVQPGFVLDDKTLRPTVHICRLVDGMPLAILLAASWTQVLAPAEIARELAFNSGASLDFLETDRREVPERQRSMRAVFDHSWSLLIAHERGVMRALSVFHGGCTRDAAQQVAGASLRDLRALIGRSMLERSSSDRYQMHELLRQYAAERLHRSPEEERAMRDRHAACYTGALQGWAADLKGPRQLEALSEIEADLDNARAAWEWALERGQVGWLDCGLEGLCLFYEWRGHYKEGKVACRRVVNHLEAYEKLAATEVPEKALRVLAGALAWQGCFGFALGQSELADQSFEHSLAILDSPGLSGRDVRLETAFVLWRSAERIWHTDLDGSRRLAVRSLALYRALGDRWGMARALLRLGATAWYLADYEEADQRFQESLNLSRALGDRRGIVGSLCGAGICAQNLGELERAERLAREGLILARQISAGELIGQAYVVLHSALSGSGRFEEAQSLQKESLARIRDHGDHRAEPGEMILLAVTERHLGLYNDAHMLLETATHLSRESGQQSNEGRCFVELGRLALAEGLDQEAQERLEQAVAAYQGVGRLWMMGETLATLAYVAHALGQPAQAWEHLYTALWMAAETQYRNTALQSLPAMALLLLDSGAPERAVELYALASRYPYVAHSRWFEDVAGREITAIAETLPPEVVAAAQERGRTRDLWATVEELLDEVAENGSQR